MVWGGAVKGHVPRLAAIVWMAYKKKLLTRDKIRECAYIQDDQCVLCNEATEDVNHLCLPLCCCCVERSAEEKWISQDRAVIRSGPRLNL